MSTVTKKKLIAPVFGLMIVVAVMFVTTTASAQTPTTNSMQTLVTRIAQKFGLSESEVQAVFDEDHKERHSKMTADFRTKLDEAVKSGKLTETQKQLILDKHAELQVNREEQKLKHEELRKWAEANGITPEFLFRGGKHRGPPTWQH